MRRIGLAVLLPLTLTLSPLDAEAQQAGTVYRVGFLSYSWSTASPQVVAAFRQGLRELAWVEGQNIVIEYRWAEGKSDRLPDLTAEFGRTRSSNNGPRPGVSIRIPAFLLQGDRVIPTRTLRPGEYSQLWKEYDLDGYLKCWADVRGERRCLNCFGALPEDSAEQKRFWSEKCRNANKQRRRLEGASKGSPSSQHSETARRSRGGARSRDFRSTRVGGRRRSRRSTASARARRRRAPRGE